MGKNKKHRNKNNHQEEIIEEKASQNKKDESIEEELTQEELTQEEESYKNKYIKLLADYENFKSRNSREKNDMIFFLKQDILLKIIPRIDDLERIRKNTPEEEKNTSVYEALLVLEKKIKSDLEQLGIKEFKSKGQEVDPNKHEVISTIPGKKENIIHDEFEKGYELQGRVLRHAKVITGAGE